jgi:hypothetical protein
MAVNFVIKPEEPDKPVEMPFAIHNLDYFKM